jgi:hypothetical protein
VPLQNAPDSHLQVVVCKAPGNPTEELEALPVPFKKRLLPLVREGDHKRITTVAQLHAEELDGLPDTVNNYFRLAKVDLRLLALLMGERNEDLRRLLAEGGHDPSDGRLAPLEAILIA